MNNTNAPTHAVINTPAAELTPDQYRRLQDESQQRLFTILKEPEILAVFLRLAQR